MLQALFNATFYPVMKLIYKHIYRELLFPLVCCLVGFSAIFVIFDLFDKLKDFSDNGMELGTILYYYALSLPEIITVTIPVCILLAVLYSLTRLTRNNEIIAMQSSGISIYRIVMPFLAIGLLGTLVTYYFNDYVAPESSYRARQLMNFYDNNRSAEDVYLINSMALKLPKKNRDWFAGEYDTRDNSMKNVTMVQHRSDGSDLVRYKAKKVLRRDGRWWFLEVVEQEFDEENNPYGPPEFILQKEMKSLDERPVSFRVAIKPPEFMTSSELRKYMRYNTELSESVIARRSVDMHHILASPAICFIVALLGVPIGNHTGRKGAFAGVAIALALFFAFYALQLTGEMLAKQGVLDPALGVWGPIGAFTALGLVFLYRLR